MIVQSNIPLPSKKAPCGRGKSQLRETAENLHVGQCITIPTRDEEEQRKVASRLSAMSGTIKRNQEGYNFTIRSMVGEIDGELHPVVRMWRTA